jgi:glycosyltransferase involved in cell wall biosynthesis
MVGGSDILLFTKDSARRRCILRVLHAADAVVAVSRNLRDRLIEMGIVAGKIRVIERGVDLELFSPGDRRSSRRKLFLPQDVPTLLWVGRMVPVKGLEVLLEACALLKQQGRRFRLNLVGDGPLRQSLGAAAARRGITDLVHFAGASAQDRLPDWYRAADLFVLPSRSEGVPNVLRESLACGTPFVATDVGGISEIASDVGNCLVPPGDAGALAGAIANRLDSPPALARSDSAGWDESARRVAMTFRELRGRDDAAVNEPEAADLIYDAGAPAARCSVAN